MSQAHACGSVSEWEMRPTYLDHLVFLLFGGGVGDERADLGRHQVEEDVVVVAVERLAWVDPGNQDRRRGLRSRLGGKRQQHTRSAHGTHTRHTWHTRSEASD
jgi:phosphoribulokinase